MVSRDHAYAQQNVLNLYISHELIGSDPPLWFLQLTSLYCITCTVFWAYEQIIKVAAPIQRGVFDELLNI